MWHKLFAVIARTRSNAQELSAVPSTSSACSTYTDSSHSSSPLTRKLFRVIVKNTMLTTMVNVMLIVIIVLYGVVMLYEREDRAQWAVLEYCLVLTINASSLCVYLSFGVNAKLYKRCCSRLERRCESVCRHLSGTQPIVAKPLELGSVQESTELHVSRLEEDDA